MRRALNVVKRIFTVRSCNFDMPKQMPERPCLDYYIKRCKAPCILAQTQGEYRAMIDEVLVFLEGRTQEVVRRVRERMELAVRVARLRARRRAARRAAASRADGRADGRAVGRRRRPRRDRVRARRRRRGRRADAHSVAASCWRASTSSSRISRRRPTAPVLEAYLAGKYLPLEDRAAELLVPFDPTRARAGRSVARAHEDPRAAARTAARARRSGDAERAAPARGASAHGRRDRRARGRSDLRAAASARPSEGAARRSSASTSRTRRAPTPSRRASGSRTAVRTAPSIASSR